MNFGTVSVIGIDPGSEQTGIAVVKCGKLLGTIKVPNGWVKDWVMDRADMRPIIVIEDMTANSQTRFGKEICDAAKFGSKLAAQLEGIGYHVVPITRGKVREHFRQYHRACYLRSCERAEKRGTFPVPSPTWDAVIKEGLTQMFGKDVIAETKSTDERAALALCVAYCEGMK